MKKIPVYFEKYANFERCGEPCSVAVPFPKGELRKTERVVIRNEEGEAFPTQVFPTALWEDGSVKWLYADFLCDLPKNKDITYYLCFDRSEREVFPQKDDFSFEILENSAVVCAGGEEFRLERESDFYLNGIRGELGGFEVLKEGEAVISLKAFGEYKGLCDFELKMEAYRGKPWVKLSHRLINRNEAAYISLESLRCELKNKGESRFTIGTSNYQTEFTEGFEEISKKIDADYLMYEANEHFAEVFYGTFFGDMSAENSGTAVTLYQAYQNFPAAITVGKEGLKAEILAANGEPIKFYRGMAKTSVLFIHKHKGITKEEINLRSLMLQAPDRGVIPSEIYNKSGCFPEIFLPKEKRIRQVEKALLGRLDGRGRAYGFIHWGDNIDYHYTDQGRGGGRPVWVNNEYDFGHAAYLYFARTGVRRALDSMLVSVRHQLDIDIVHSSDEPLRLDGQVTHSADHVSGKVEISHEWAEGILDYYHVTGDKDAFSAALKMGENALRHLELPRYHKKGGINARETGWALRLLCALYKETNDEHWLKPCDHIVEHFKAWREEYGGWLAPYTDHTVIRVPFMISIAIISLMSYYNIRKNDEIKEMILSAADDLIENAYLDSGFFYYKELPSLKRNAGNTTILQALAIAYELSGDKTYLGFGIKTFEAAVSEKSVILSFSKKKLEDAVVLSGQSSKGIGQSFLPLLTYYTVCVNAGINIDL